MMDPPVSVPIEKPTSPAAVAEPGPADDPDASLGIPRVAGQTSEPAGGYGQRACRELRDQDRSRVGESAVHAGVQIDNPVPVGRHPPRRLRSSHREQVFESPRDAMQGAAVGACGDFFVRSPSLTQSQILGETDHAQEPGVISLQPRQV